MAENSRQSKLGSKDDECIFTWKLFTGWDFMIGHSETAANRLSSVILGFKEALLEESERKKNDRSWKVLLIRILVNLSVLGLLAASTWAVYWVVDRSDDEDAEHSWYRRNEITIVITVISFFFPMFFEALGLVEQYHPRKQLRLQLARIMLLNMLNLYSLIFSLFAKVNGYTEQLGLILYCKQRDEGELGGPIDLVAMFHEWQARIKAIEMTDISTTTIMSTTQMSTTETFQTEWTTIISTTMEPVTVCYDIFVNCTTPALTTLLLLNLTTTMLPETTTLPTTTGIASDFNVTETTNFFDWTEYTESPTNVNSAVTIPPATEVWSDEEYNDYIQNLEEIYPNDLPLGEMVRFRRAIDFPKWNKLQELTTQMTQTTNTEEILGNFTEFVRTTTVSSFNDTEFLTTINSTDYQDFVTEMLQKILQQTTINDKGEICEVKRICQTESSQNYAKTTPMTALSRIKRQYDPYKRKKTCNDLSPDILRNWENEAKGVNISDCLCGKFNETDEKNACVKDTVCGTDFSTYEKRDRKLRQLCWETWFGQELVKLTVMDLVVTVTSTLLLDFIRALWVRWTNGAWCWDLEKQWPGYGDFKIAENILHLVNNQGMVWMGLFFSPGLALINLIKLAIIMYLRSWTVLTCNVPHEVVFRASRSNNFYLALLLSMLFLCVLPVSYAIISLQPSWHCGPFPTTTTNSSIYRQITADVDRALPAFLHDAADYLSSPAAIIPLLILLILIIYYLISLTGSLREANQDLKDQLRKERTEERKKMWKLAEEQTKEPKNVQALSSRWKKVLQTAQSPTAAAAGDDAKAQARKDLLARIMKKALRKGSATSDEESGAAQAGDDGTDTEMHESLPHDDKARKKKTLKPGGGGGGMKSRLKGPWAQIIQMAKEKTSEAEAAGAASTDSSKRVINSHPLAKFRIERKDATEKKENTENLKKESSKGELKKDKKSEEEECEEKIRVVSERRRSLLRRQEGTSEEGTSKESAKSIDDQVKVEEVNEKTKHKPFRLTKPTLPTLPEKGALSDVKKPPTDTSPLPQPQPIVFKFDEIPKGDVSPLSSTSPEPSSPKTPDKPKKAPFSFKGFVSPKKDYDSKSEDPKKPDSPIYAVPSKIIKKEDSKKHPKQSDTKDSDVKDDLHKKSTDKLLSSDPNLAEESTTPKKETGKGMKKFNKFFTRVKDSVQKKSDVEASGTKTGTAKTADTTPKASSSKQTHQSSSEKKPAKREDSLTSIWSDNIPVIKISKTESDECILEDSGDDKEKEKDKKKD